MNLDALAFGAHPDDVELTCAGTLIKLNTRGYKTGVINLTRAELSTRGTPELRQKEFDEAAKIMGVAIHKAMDIPDGNIEINWLNKMKVIREIREYRPGIIFIPYWEDRHPDHSNASTLIREAAFLAGLKKIDTGQEPHRPYKVIFHQSRFEFKPTFIVDISDHHEQKLRAIMAYQSQFFHPEMHTHGQDQVYISRPAFIEAIINRAKQYGAYIGVAYGEPFLVREAIKLDDPVAFFGPEYLYTIP